MPQNSLRMDIFNMFFVIIRCIIFFAIWTYNSISLFAFLLNLRGYRLSTIQAEIGVWLIFRTTSTVTHIFQDFNYLFMGVRRIFRRFFLLLQLANPRLLRTIARPLRQHLFPFCNTSE